VILAAACFAESTVLIKIFPGTHPVTTNAIAMLTGSLLLFGFAAVWGEKLTLPTLPATWLALLYLTVIGSVVVFMLVIFVIKHWTASASSYSFVLMPIVTVLVATWLANESITIPLIAGGVLVLSGAYVGSIANTELWKCYLLNLVNRWRPAIPGCD
jgi:drug/metabolite transporter (DMT)-like permease